MSRGLVILGTDTGVGKTHVACGLARGLAARGIRPAALKPVESGYDEASCDGRLLAEACGEEFDPDRHVPQRFQLPLAPLAAGREEGRSLDLDLLTRQAHERARDCDLLLVETAGGLRVPLTERASNLELAVRLGWPALVVGRAGLGTINHCVLTLEAAVRADISLVGFVLNGEEELSSRAGGGNARIIQEMTGVPCLGEIPRSEPSSVADHLDWQTILKALEGATT